MAFSFGEERRELAGAFRWASRLGLNEGVDNHFSLSVGDDLFLVNPFAIHWSQVRASDLLLVNGDGRILEGSGELETTSFFIHRAVHRARPAARCALHTHMPHATAIGCLEGGRLEPLHQNAARFIGRTAYDDAFNGLALDADEGERIARQLGDNQVLFMANHGVMVVGATVAEAFDALYFLERACQLQVLACSMGRPLRRLPADTVAKTSAQKAKTSAQIAPRHFNALLAILDREEPEYRT